MPFDDELELENYVAFFVTQLEVDEIDDEVLLEVLEYTVIDDDDGINEVFEILVARVPVDDDEDEVEIDVDDDVPLLENDEYDI